MRSVQIGDIEMAYAEMGASTAPHRVLLVHGIPTSSHLYRNVQAHLGPDFNTIAVDLPGYGRSSKPRGYDYGLENLSNALGAFKSEIYGDEPLHIVIHDIGGPVGLGWVVTHLKEVLSLTILNTTVFPERFRPPYVAMLGGIPLLGNWLIKRAPVNVFRRGMKREFRHGISDEDLVGYVEPYEAPDGRDAIAAMADTFTGYTRSIGFIRMLRRELKNIDVPTQIVFGGADRYCVPPNGQAFADHIPNSTFEVLDGVGHFVSEEVPEVIADRVAGLVRSVS